MKISVLAPILDLDGKEVRLPAEKEGGQPGPIMTLGTGMKGALLAHLPGDEDDKTGTKGFERFLLAERIHRAEGFVEISIEEAQTIKARAARSYSTLFYGRIWQALEAAAAGG
jgi:hypothetical protein